MNVYRSVSVLGGALLLLVAAPSASLAQGPPVLQVFVIEVDAGGVDDYLTELKAAQAILKRLGLDGFRVFQNTAAGPNTGNVIVSVQNKDMMALAQNQAKLQGDAEWQKWVERQQKSKLRTVVSNSLMVELTAQTQ